MDAFRRDEEGEEEERPEVELYVASGGNLFNSRVAQRDDVLNEKLESAFHQQTSQVLFHTVAKISSEHDPIDLAYAVARLPPYARAVVYDNLSDDQAKIIFMINTDSVTRTAIFREIDDEEIRQLIVGMPPDEAVYLLDDLSDRRLKRILDLLEPKKAQHICDLQAHDRHSAGRMMTNEFFSFDLNTTIGEVISHIRNHPGIDLTRRIFVLNLQGVLIGYVPARNLMVNPHELPIRQVMRPISHSVEPDCPRDEVVDLVIRYKDPALPVVEPQTGILLGVVLQDDVIEAMEDMASQTIASFAGTAEEVGEQEPPFKRFFWRAPWLVVTLGVGLTTSTAMQGLSDRIWFASLPFFVPLITGMSGNVGIQCSSILVRGISTGELSPRSMRSAIAQELTIGLMVGAVFGCCCAVVVYGLSLTGFPHVGANHFGQAVTIGIGVFCACMTAATLGSVLPFFFARCRIDPAIASGPIVTAFNDLLSTLMFFLVSRLTYFFLA